MRYALVLLVMLAGCDLEPPERVRDCVRYETRERYVHKSAAPGHVGAGPLRKVTWRECVEWRRRRAR